MLKKTLIEKISYAEINNSKDGSRIILGDGVSFDFKRYAVPTGLATIIAASLQPRLFRKL